MQRSRLASASSRRPTERRALSLNEAGVVLYDCDHRTPKANPDGYPYIAIPQMVDGRLDVATARRISKEDWVEWTKRIRPRPGDVVVSRRCNPGETAVVPEGLDCALGQNLLILRSEGPYIEQAFLRWLVRGPEWWGQVRSHLNVGAVFDSLRCDDIPRFRLEIPSVREQRAIARVLCSLDDKIELNRLMNQTLEEICRALFKFWFVDFGPVRAKAESRWKNGQSLPGMPANTWDLWPNAFEESEIGEIPKGWTTTRLADPISIRGRIGWKGLKSSEFGTDGVLIVNGPQIVNGAVDWSACDRIPRWRYQESPEIALRPGDVLLSKDGTIGRIAYLDRLPQPATVASGIFVIRANGDNSNLALYVRFLFESEGFRNLLRERVEGSVIPHIYQRDFEEFVVTLPPSGLLDKFGACVGPIISAMMGNGELSRTLASLRDALLPKLLSGEIRVSADDGE